MDYWTLSDDDLSWRRAGAARRYALSIAKIDAVVSYVTRDKHAIVYREPSAAAAVLGFSDRDTCLAIRCRAVDESTSNEDAVQYLLSVIRDIARTQAPPP